MQRESLHCGELIKRLNDILGRCANEELRADDMTSSQVKMLMIINETKDECFFNDTATTEIYTLSLNDALPIWYIWKSGV